MKKNTETTDQDAMVPILSLKGITKTLDYREILHGVSLEVLPGEIF